MIIGTGCSDKKENGTKYLNEKYGQEFIPFSKGMNNYVDNKEKTTYYTQGMISEYEYVTLFKKKGVLRTKYRDNYFGFIVQDEVEALVSKALAGEFSQYLVINPVNDEPMPDKLGKKNKLKDLYKEDPDYVMSVIVFVKAEEGLTEQDYVQKVSNLETKLHKTKYNLQLFAINDEYYNKINRYDYSAFWDYYVRHNSPDHKVYEYAYDKVIQ